MNNQPLTANDKTSTPEFLSGGGQMGQRIREYNWSQTPLGQPHTWPQSLRTSVSICLSSNFPICIYWGKEHVLIYNNAWSTIPGRKHPWALGKTGREVWPEIWADIEPWFDAAFLGEPVGAADQLLIMERHGYPEECFFDFTFTPIHGDSGKVEGVFNAVIETTYRVINERRSKLLQELNKEINQAASIDGMIEAAMTVIKTGKKDIPFAALYLMKGNAAELAASDVELHETQKKITLDGTAPQNTLASYINNLLLERAAQLIDDVEKAIGETPPGFWPEPVTQALLLPLVAANGKPTGVLLAGISSRREMDKDYQVFLENIASSISNEINNLVSFEEERRRAEALAEIDKAKTLFFSNISHEFRTPLTLMLGPIEDALNDPATIPDNVVRMDLAHRNGLRLQKLVNTLLEFSRIEAGRLEGKFVKVDVCSFTQDLASVFRSAVEKAGMSLRIVCGEVKSDVYVDADMWEKIVLNLISNAFKYSNEGSITVEVKQVADEVILSVADTGVGIPEEHLDKIFDRFHRVEGIGGRSGEGTGIGLAMVKELAKLHGGTISVESKLGSGSTFTVRIPVGKQHLKQVANGNAAAPTLSTQSEAFVQEALKWLPDEPLTDGKDLPEEPLVRLAPAAGGGKYKVLLADDNADMRDYIFRLLSPGFEVITATDGEQAFQKAMEHQPALIVTDVMMPKLDGFELLKRIRETANVKNIPVIFLSARAGDEAKVEGLGAGADDYIVKPFSAKELVARVEAQIKIKESREKAYRDLYHLFDEVPFAVAALMGEELVIDYVNQYTLSIWGRTKEDVLGRRMFDVVPETRAGAEAIHAEVYRTGKRFVANELPVEVMTGGKNQTRYFNSIVDPLCNEQGQIIGQLATTIEVTEQVVSRQKLEESYKAADAYLRNVFMQTPAVICILKGPQHVYTLANKMYDEIVGHREVLGKPIREALPEFEGQGFFELLDNVYQTGQPFYGNEVPVRLDKGKEVEAIFLNFIYEPTFDAAKNVDGILVLAVEVTEQVMARKKIEESEAALRTANEQLAQTKAQLELAFNNIPSAIYLLDNAGKIIYLNEPAAHLLGYTSVAEVLIEKNLAAFREKLAEAFELLDEWGQPVAVQNRPVSITLQTGKPSELVMQAVSKKDNKVIWLLNKASPVFNNDGTLAYALIVSTDITLSKQTEKTVRESEERYATVINASELGIWDFDVLNQRLIGAGKMAEIYGLPSNEEYNLQQVFESIHPDDRAAQQKLFGDIIDSKITDAFATSYRIIQENTGNVRWIYATARAFFKNDGVLYRTVGTVADITKQKEAEERITQSEEQFRTLSNAIPQLAWMTDEKGWIWWYNQRWYDYTGTTLEEMQGWGWRTVHHPTMIDGVVERFQKALDAGVDWEDTFLLRSKEGGYRWFLSRAQVLRNADGSIRGWFGTNTDVTEQRAAAEALKESESRFRTLATAIPQIVWMNDEKGNMEHITQNWTDYTGQTLEEAMAHAPDLIYPDDVAAVWKSWEQSFTAGQEWKHEYRLRSKHGEYRWFSAILSPLKNEAGKITKWIGAATDIHEQKQFSEELEKLVAERTAELQQSNESLQQFAHVASHDLKEPVRKIRTFSGRLEEEIKPFLTDKAQVYFDKIHSATDRIFSMIEGVLFYSTLNASEQLIDKVDINEIFRNIETDVEVTIQQKDATLSHANLPVIEGAKVLIYQLFYNLVNNSLKFSKPGVPPHITIRSAINEGMAEITVQDNGIGFEQAQAGKIFDAFSRLNAKDKFDGTGLGLSLCKKIVERHHGSIEAKGATGEGATFLVRLPLHQTAKII